MTVPQLISLSIAVSIFLTVLALGLQSRVGDALWLFHRPSLLIRSLLSLNVVMALLAVAAAKLLQLNPAIETAIIALAISPVPPFFPKKDKKVGATDPYALSLLVAASVFSVVFIPAWLQTLGMIFGFNAHLALVPICKIVFIKILLRLCCGNLIRYLAEAFADRIARIVSVCAMLFLVLGVLPIIYVSSGAMWATVGHGVLISLVLFALVGLAVGHLLGGPDPDHSSILALATSTRHPGIAIAV